MLYARGQINHFVILYGFVSNLQRHTMEELKSYVLKYLK